MNQPRPSQFSLRDLFRSVTCFSVALGIVAFNFHFLSTVADEPAIAGLQLLSIPLVIILVAGGAGALRGQFVSWIVWTTFAMLLFSSCGAVAFVLTEGFKAIVR
jgi:hypothetical protein